MGSAVPPFKNNRNNYQSQSSERDDSSKIALSGQTKRKREVGASGDATVPKIKKNQDERKMNIAESDSELDNSSRCSENYNESNSDPRVDVPSASSKVHAISNEIQTQNEFHNEKKKKKSNRA